MVNAVPFDTLFDRVSIKNNRAVKLPENPIMPENPSLDSQSNSIVALFETLGAVELATITRHDMVSGSVVSYGLTGEVDDVTKEVTARMLRSGTPPAPPQGGIDISTYISEFDLTDSTLPGIMINDNGELVINLFKLGQDERVEVQALSGGNIININYGLEY